MYVVTADQINSRSDQDRAGDLIRALSAEFQSAFVLPPDQTAGDEIQFMIQDAGAAFDAILLAQRSGHWSIGLGIGTVRTPLAASTRQAVGGAFIAARDAVTRAKRTETRFALATVNTETEAAGLAADELEALIGMLLLLRQRRSVEGWQAIDLVQSGLSQAEAALHLGISTAAISQRLKTAAWRAERAARPALVKLLTDLHRRTLETEPTA
jgi:hypothetical protein